MRIRLAALMAAVPLLFGSAAAVAGATGAAATVTPATASGPCGTLATAPTYSHVIVIMMENHSYNRQDHDHGLQSLASAFPAPPSWAGAALARRR